MPKTSQIPPVVSIQYRLVTDRRIQRIIEALRLCAIYKSATDNDIDFGIASRGKK